MKLLLTALFTLLAGTANAALITPASITGTGTYNNSADLITDGTYPVEWSVWTGATSVWWYGTTPTFTIDLGALYALEDVVLSVDNNDSYSVMSSTDGSSWSTLFIIDRTYGDVGWGMDTMSSIAGDTEYVPGIDFATQNARYLLLSAVSGDNAYAIGELQAYGTLAATTAVASPATLALFGLGLCGLQLLRRKPGA